MLRLDLKRYWIRRKMGRRRAFPVKREMVIRKKLKALNLKWGRRMSPNF